MTLELIINAIESIPFGIHHKLNSDLGNIKNKLDQNIFGLESVKRDLLKSISSQIFSKGKGYKTICFVGEPGVGKTYLAQQLAECMSRPIHFIPGSSITTQEKIKGGIMQWTGSEYGEITKALIKTKSMDPIIVFDEIDKISKNYREGSGIQSAFLEIFDPNQQVHFIDLFLGIGYDISNVWFICTANKVDDIPEALRDRIDFIEVSKYLEDEKFHMLKNYLLPKYISNLLSKEVGTFDQSSFSLIVMSSKLAEIQNKISFTDEAMKYFIDHFSENSIRSLEKGLFNFFSSLIYEANFIDLDTIKSSNWIIGVSEIKKYLNLN